VDYLSAPYTAIRLPALYNSSYLRLWHHPPVSPGSQIIQILRLYEMATSSCRHHGCALLQLPPSVLGRLARSSSCSLCYEACTTIALQLAMEVPILLSRTNTVGRIGDTIFLHSPQCCSLQRLIYVGYDEAYGQLQPICRLRVRQMVIFLYLYDTPSAARCSPLHFSELRTFLNRKRNARWLLQTDQTLPLPPYAVSLDVSVTLSLSLAQASFTTTSASTTWCESCLGLQPFVTGPLSVNRWTTEFRLLRQRQFDSLLYARSFVVQKVCAVWSPTQDILTTPGCYVYAMVSPYWGKCYVGALGFHSDKNPLQRWIEHMRLARLWGSKTSQNRYASRCPPLYAAMSKVGLQNVVFGIIARTNRSALAVTEQYYIRLLQPVLIFRR